MKRAKEINCGIGRTLVLGGENCKIDELAVDFPSNIKSIAPSARP
jgi:hypothetical protein